MERQEFLKTLGISFATVCAGSCINACSKKNEETPQPLPPAGIKATLNLSDIPNIGQKKIESGIAFFRIAAGDTATSFIATQAFCSHADGELLWKAKDNLIQCQFHFAEFDKNGANTRLPQSGGNAPNLKTYAINVANGKVNALVG
ncbi:MAG: Rieske (2Fe-2S) protein [Sphingobacteriales bacterium]|nr:MAG: Rieske (2Fe-2S) protein [Sphingobacteriales bacterium]TAF78948.1 MAG: Rieske (2Fe-2S) protein [Sphingobacteriales bacterium]